MNLSDPNSIAERVAKNRMILNYFGISSALLIVPIALVWLVLSDRAVSHWPAWTGYAILIVWLVSAISGILYGLRSCLLADRKTDGFGILAILLHACSLLFWSCLVAAALRPD